MKIKFALICGLAAALVSTAALAEDLTARRFDVGFDMGGMIPANNDDDSGTGIENEAGFAMNGNFAWHATPYFAVGFEVGFVQTEEKDGSGFRYGSAKGVPIFADLYLTLPLPEQNLEPYLVTGFGTVLWDYDVSADLKAAFPSVEQVNVDNAFAFKLGGGLNWMVGSNWILNFELAYVFDQARTTVITRSGSYANTGDVDYWTIMGGLKYAFN